MLTEASVASEDDVWETSCGAVASAECDGYHFLASSHKWVRYAFSLYLVEARTTGVVWGLDSEGRVFQYRASSNDFVSGNGFQYLAGGPTVPAADRDRLGEVSVGFDGRRIGLGCRHHR